ncbi:MAG: MFS transporter [Candidatus Odinarchaeota archaeon]
MKVVQKHDARSDNSLDKNPLDDKADIPAFNEDLDHMDIQEGHEPQDGLRASLTAIFSWKNYRIYLITGWVFNAFSYLTTFFNLYLWDIIPNLIFIGAIGSITSAVATIARFFGGYVGDTVNRKSLSVISFLLMGIYYLMIGIFIDPVFIFMALIVYSSVDLTKSGSTAYIMDNMPQEHSGLALSLFTAGRALSIITLAVFAFLYPFVEFEAYRQLHLVGGVLLLVCTIARAAYLKSIPSKKRETGTKLWRSFIQDNSRALRILLRMVPGMVVVCVLDAISDSFFNLGSLIYMYDVLFIDVQSITIMLIVTLTIQVPLLLKIGRLSDKKGVKSIALLVYTAMPISAALMILAYWFPNWAPSSFVDSANLMIPGLGVIFNFSFLAVVLKYVNDTLWYTIMLVLIRKRMPGQDTSKILAMFWFVIYLASSFGPFIGGMLSEVTSILNLFVVVLILNLLILGAIARYDLTEKGQQVPND